MFTEGQFMGETMNGFKYCQVIVRVGLAQNGKQVRTVVVLRPTNHMSMAQDLFKVGTAKGYSLHVPGIFKNASGSVRIRLKRTASGAGR